jgi:hypothetical protein
LNLDTNFREATTCWADQVAFAEIDAADNVDARVVECGKCDACRHVAKPQLIPAKTNQQMGYCGIHANPHSY